MLRGPSELSCQFWESSEIDSCERLFFQRASDLDPVGITALVRKPASLPPRLFKTAPNDASWNNNNATEDWPSSVQRHPKGKLLVD